MLPFCLFEDHMLSDENRLLNGDNSDTDRYNQLIRQLLIILKGGIVLASDSVKKILAAEAESDKKISDAKKMRDNIISDASGKASLAVQKRLSEASAEAVKLREDISKKTENYRREAESKCEEQLDFITSQAQKNTDNAIKAVISEFF